MSAPWPSLFPTSVALAMCGLGGLAYGAIVVRRARRQTDYRPVWEDWFWYAQLPTFVIGAAALGLLLVGIHNAWDSVTHLVVGGGHQDSTAGTSDPAEERGEPRVPCG